MGWFDNEQEEGMKPASTSQSAPSRPATANNPGKNPSPASKSPIPSASGSGSTLGPQIHIDGTIVCDEDLTILGRVDGTIRAKGTLVIAKEADVHARIDGQRVVVHGEVDGDVHGAERVTIGQTGRLKGNIETPSLEIVEGAHFKGNVDMKSKAPADSAAKPATPPMVKPNKPEESGDKSGSPKPSLAGDKADDKAAAQKQATT